jgi:hypothetical protein
VTFGQVVTAVLRRWYVPLVVLVAAAAITTQLVKSGGLYSTRTVVMLVNSRPLPVYPPRPPGSPQVAIGPDNGSENDNIIAFAGAVANDVNNGRPVVRYAQDDAPLYGAGISQGVFVGLPDDGGQWMTSFTRAELEIEIVGPTHDYVASMQQELLLKVSTRVRELQGPAYDNPDSRILTQVVSPSLEIDHVSASGSQLVMAVASMLTAALIVGSWGTVRLDALLRGRSARRKRKMERTDLMPKRTS